MEQREEGTIRPLAPVLGEVRRHAEQEQGGRRIEGGPGVQVKGATRPGRFADELQTKQEGIFRLLSGNVNTLTSSNSVTEETAKEKMLRELLENTEADAMAIQELNNFYKNVPTNEHPQERTKRWAKPSRLLHAYNKHDD